MTRKARVLRRRRAHPPSLHRDPSRFPPRSPPLVSWLAPPGGPADDDLLSWVNKTRTVHQQRRAEEEKKRALEEAKRR